jgi:hypothetical protein
VLLVHCVELGVHDGDPQVFWSAPVWARVVLWLRASVWARVVLWVLLFSLHDPFFLVVRWYPNS